MFWGRGLIINTRSNDTGGVFPFFFGASNYVTPQEAMESATEQMREHGFEPFEYMIDDGTDEFELGQGTPDEVASLLNDQEEKKAEAATREAWETDPEAWKGEEQTEEFVVLIWNDQKNQ